MTKMDYIRIYMADDYDNGKESIAHIYFPFLSPRKFREMMNKCCHIAGYIPQKTEEGLPETYIIYGFMSDELSQELIDYINSEIHCGSSLKKLASL